MVGEPLVKKRFPLSKLAWITYLGPSANRVFNADVSSSTSPGVSSADYDLWQLVHIYGIPLSYLEQGTPANIYKYFGLIWQQDTIPTSGSHLPASFHDNEYKWFYSGHNTIPGGTTPGSPTLSNTAGPISRLQSHRQSRHKRPGPGFLRTTQSRCGSRVESQGVHELYDRSFQRLPRTDSPVRLSSRARCKPRLRDHPARRRHHRSIQSRWIFPRASSLTTASILFMNLAEWKTSLICTASILQRLSCEWRFRAFRATHKPAF